MTNDGSNSIKAHPPMADDKLHEKRVVLFASCSFLLQQERSSPVYSFQPDRKRSPLHSSMLYWLQIDRNQREGDCKRRGGGPINKTSPERQKVSL